MIAKMLCGLVSLCLLQGLAVAETALVTGLVGKVERADAAAPLLPFVRLKSGQRLILDRDSRLQLVYLGSGRHESWKGPGQLEIGEADSRGGDIRAPGVRQIPPLVLAQLAKTPVAEGGVTTMARRQRSIPPPDAVNRVETTYRQMRAEAALDDLEPELFLLSGMFELRQLERVEEIVADIMQKHPADPQAKLLASLYRKSLRNLRESGK